eukprot:5054746-Pyramimonas_sp.AAC.1
MAPPGPPGGALPIALPLEEAASVAGTGSSGAAASTAGHLAPFQPASLPDTGQLRPVKCAVQSFHRTGIPFFLRVVDEMPLLKSRRSTVS